MKHQHVALYQNRNPKRDVPRTPTNIFGGVSASQRSAGDSRLGAVQKSATGRQELLFAGHATPFVSCQLIICTPHWGSTSPAARSWDPSTSHSQTAQPEANMEDPEHTRTGESSPRYLVQNPRLARGGCVCWFGGLACIGVCFFC